MASFLVHYSSEIGLKGFNKPVFEKKVIDNARLMLDRELGKDSVAITRMQARFLVDVKSNQSAAAEVLGRVFGLSWFAPITICKAEQQAVAEAAERALAEELQKNPGAQTLCVEFNRADKRYPGTSLDAKMALGKLLGEKFGLKVRLNNPDAKLFVEVAEGRAFVFTQKIRGASGLPVGISGRAVLLLSGGIDSPVAAWMLLRKGLEIVLLHFHPFREEEAIHTTKVQELAKRLAAWSPQPLKLYAAPFAPFLAASAGLPERFGQVSFRRFMLACACEIAEKEHALAVATGESLGQVASQTLPNLAVIDTASSQLVLRPLLALDKAQIIALAQDIGTYDVSLVKYNDCCQSLNPKHPSTNSPLERLQSAEFKLDLKKILESTLQQSRVASISAQCTTAFSAIV